MYCSWNNSNKKQYILNIGPQHPSTHGLVRFELLLEDELIIDVKIHRGYLHRNIEELIKNKSYLQTIPYLDRLDYLSSLCTEHAYVLTIEKLLGITDEIPEYVEYRRILVSEINRIASHLIAIGTFGMDLGCTTAFLWTMKSREFIIQLLQKLTKKRLLYNYINIGYAPEIDNLLLDDIHDLMNKLSRELPDLDILLFNNMIFKSRTVNIGIKKTNVTGPCIRATGKKYDIRKTNSYSLYSKLDFDIPILKNADSYDRMKIRYLECFESIKIIDQIMPILKSHQYSDFKMKKIPVLNEDKEIECKYENPRGEICFNIKMNAYDNKPICKLTTPSMINLTNLENVIKNHCLSDLFAIWGSMDIIISEVDK